MNLTTALLDYEAGDLGPGETLALFGELVRTGVASQLQGAYGRTAAAFITAGFLTQEGEITPLGRAFSTDMRKALHATPKEEA